MNCFIFFQQKRLVWVAELQENYYNVYQKKKYAKKWQSEILMNFIAERIGRYLGGKEV